MLVGTDPDAKLVDRTGFFCSVCHGDNLHVPTLYLIIFQAIT
jgi:hypothetical protein